jgi:hypothetical protein
VRSEVLQLDREGAHLGLEGTPAREIREVDLRLHQVEPVDPEDPWACLLPRGRLALVGGQGVEDVLHLEAALAVQARAQVELHELQRVESGLLLHQRPELRVHVEPVPGEPRAPVAFLHQQAIDGDREREGIHAHLLHGDLPVQEGRGALLQLAADHPG